MTDKNMYDWTHNDPRRLTFPARGSSVVTRTLLSYNRIITASDDHEIHVYSQVTGDLLHNLPGHEGGVWAIAVSPNSPDVLVSGSTDRTMRVWDLTTGKCTHIFGGHTSTVRRLVIVKPVWVDVDGRNEKWPKRSLVVTGSRDNTARVWKLPKQGSEDGNTVDLSETDSNPYLVHILQGHTHVVRDLAAHGRIMVSASYDTTSKVWDIINGECKWTLHCHTQKGIYLRIFSSTGLHFILKFCSVAIDPERNQAVSGPMDGTVRIWSLGTGHTSLIGLPGASPSNIVSAAADATLRVWDPSTGSLKHELSAHTGAITCFQHDELKVVSGSDGKLLMCDIHEGKVACEMLTGVTRVWQVAFQGRWCAAASNRGEQTYIDTWDFDYNSEEGKGKVEVKLEVSEEESDDEDR